MRFDHTVIKDGVLYMTGEEVPEGEVVTVGNEPTEQPTETPTRRGRKTKVTE